MFMGPLEAVKPWSMAGVNGVRGFLDRVWRLIVDDKAEELKLNAAGARRRADRRADPHAAQDDQARDRRHRAVAFNTAIARMMEFTNFFTKQTVRPRAVMEQFVLLLSPFAPHMAEELWQLLGHEQDAGLRAVAEVRRRADQGRRDRNPRADHRQAPRQGRRPRRQRPGHHRRRRPRRRPHRRAARRQRVVKTIVVPGKLVNFVVK